MRPRRGRWLLLQELQRDSLAAWHCRQPAWQRESPRAGLSRALPAGEELPEADPSPPFQPCWWLVSPLAAG